MSISSPLARLLALALLVLTLAGCTSLPGPVNARRFDHPVRVACIGDSITQGVGAEKGRSYPAQLQDLLGGAWTVKNFGVSGRTLLRKGNAPYWKEKAFQQAQEFQPEVVVIMLGTNDTKPQNWVHRDEFYNDYRDLVATFASLKSKPRIFVCRPCPVPEPGNFGINEPNVLVELPLIEQLARKQHLGVIDIYGALKPTPELLPDRVHPNTRGATVMAQTVYRALTGREAPPSTAP